MRTNLFLIILEALWARGEDGEVLARELMSALKHAIAQGTGFTTDDDILGEVRLLLEKIK